MPIPSRLTEYIVAAMVIILAPGPSVLFVIARAIAWGRKTAIYTVAGNVTGAFTLSAVVAVGLGPILSRSELAYHDVTAQGDVSSGALRSMRDGFWVGALNPKGLVFFAAVVPAFIDRERGEITAQLILLGGIFAFLAFFCDGAWGLLAGTARAWLATDSSRIEKLRATGGIVMLILGGSVIVGAVVSST